MSLLPELFEKKIPLQGGGHVDTLAAPHRYARLAGGHGEDVETPDEREAREASDSYHRGSSDIISYLEKQKTGFQTTIGDKTYLRGMDGVFEKRILPRELIDIEPQEYHNPVLIKHYEELLSNPKTVNTVDAVTVHPKTNGRFELTDGHHRIEAADRKGFDKIPAWIPLNKAPLEKEVKHETE